MAKRTPPWIKAVLPLLLPLHALHAQENPCSVPDSLANVGVVVGKVVDIQNQLPLGFVQLRLQVTGVREVFEVRSGTSGEFHFCEVPPGLFTITGHFGQMSGLFGPAEMDPGETFFIRMEVGELSVTYETGTLTGSVMDDDSGEPVDGATVLLPDLGQAAVTSSLGRFTFPSIPPGPTEIQVRRIGLAEVTGQVEVEIGKTVETRVRLIPEAIEMEPITVVGVQRRVALPDMEDLERRYHSGLGRFILEEDIQARNPSKLTDVLYGSEVEVVAAEGGGIAMRRTGCAPEVYLDGVKLTHVHRSANVQQRESFRKPDTSSLQGRSYSAEEEAEVAVNRVHPLSVLAVEVYREPAETPGQFLSSNVRCGVILVWTRRGNISGG